MKCWHQPVLRSATVYGLHDTDYEIARALQHEELAAKLSQAQLSEYKAVKEYRPVWEKYDRYVAQLPAQMEQSSLSRILLQLHSAPTRGTQVVQRDKD